MCAWANKVSCQPNLQPALTCGTYVCVHACMCVCMYVGVRICHAHYDALMCGSAQAGPPGYTLAETDYLALVSGDWVGKW